jgi:hypothetical protein
MLYLVVRMGMELPSEIFPGGRPRCIRLRVVKFYIDDTVTCSCKCHKRVGIPCRHIIAIVGDFLCNMIGVRWRSSLQAYFDVPGQDHHCSVKTPQVQEEAVQIHPTST